VTYAAKIDKAEARLDWNRPASMVDRHIRGLSPFPGAWCEINGERVKVLTSRLAEGQGAPGEVLDDRLREACATGAVQLLRLQRAGKAAQDAEDLLRGWQVPKGTRLSEV
jgi:methionyl-tRNA formyltransferase